MSEGKITDDGRSVVFNQPAMEGICCEVQHPVQSGKPFDDRGGMCGVGVVVLPTGQPRLVLQIRHADGTSLTANWVDSQAQAMIECIADARDLANEIASAALRAKGRAS